jgi:hypothetical protein
VSVVPFLLCIHGALRAYRRNGLFGNCHRGPSGLVRQMVKFVKAGMGVYGAGVGFE